MKACAIRGFPRNLAWSFRVFGKSFVGNSYYNEEPPDVLKDKEPDEILWAFNSEDLYNRLENYVRENGVVRAYLISNKKGRYGGGIVAVGEISLQSLRGKISWEYWPDLSDRGGWDYKFFIKIEDAVPELMRYYRENISGKRQDIGDVNVIMSWFTENVVPVIPFNANIGSFSKIDDKTDKLLIKMVKAQWKKERVIPAVAGEKDYFKEFLKIHLYAGRNIIIYGPPGIGKTTLAKQLLSEMDIRYDLRTGNPEWTIYDTLGGTLVSSGEFKLGFLLKSVLNCWERLYNKGRPYWLILDEINRANVDLCFGEVFTALDVSHRDEVPILSESILNQFKDSYMFLSKYDGDLKVPYSYRIVATMNSYDKAMLYRLGYALLRRFVPVPYSNKVIIENTANIREISMKISDKASPYEEISLDWIKKTIISELTLSRDEWRDYATIDLELSDKEKLLERFEEMNAEDTSPLNLIVNIARFMNGELEQKIGGNSGVTLGPLIDSIKYVLLATEVFDGEIGKLSIRIVDEAVASYFLPQLDPLSDLIRAEKLDIPTVTDKISRAIEEIRKTLEEAKLSQRTIPMLNKILNGERVF